MKLVVATNNTGKVKEIISLLQGLKITILSLNDISMDMKVIEDGSTYKENALKKGEYVSTMAGIIAVSDDSGLEVDALSGRPGINSSRFCGQKNDDHKRNKKLLELMKEIPVKARGCRFVCVAAVVCPSLGINKTFRGECQGRISIRPEGTMGFGYDPIFYLPEYGKTFSELDTEEKNRISHRAKAFKKACEFIKQVI